MKCKTIALCGFFAVLLFAAPTVFTSVSIDARENTSCLSLTEQIDEVNSALSALSGDPAYGGFYYEGDTLIVNVVDEQTDVCQQIQAIISAYPDVDIRYQYVKYSLDFLESVKDSLAPHMYTWGIFTLDANEVTNQVDISLKCYNDQVQASITEFVDNTFGASDCLNFIDYSPFTIKLCCN